MDTTVENRGNAVAERKRPFDTYDFTVERVEDLTPRDKSILLRLPEGKKMDFKAGQFVQIFVPAPGKVRRSAYSIASPPGRPELIELCVTRVQGGASSGYLHNLKAGDRLRGIGPLGVFTFRETGREPVFMATGSCIAPLRSMVYDRLDKGDARPLRLLYGNRFEHDIIYRGEIEDLAQEHSNFRPLLTLSRPADTWKGKQGYVQDHLEGFVPELTDKEYYVCGLVKMIKSVEEKLSALGVPKEQIHYERYD